MRSIGIRRVLTFLFFVLSICAWLGRGEAQEVKKYVGSEACKACHGEEYENFMKHSKQAKSYESIAMMEKGLTETELQGCYKCHTTGYGEPGGFRSVEETPQLENAGCETCHGPGSIHCETGDRKDIRGKLTTADCKQCHNAQRVESFGFTPMIYGGVH